ncbi:unnamed protein product [Arabidopsis thaliana]|uniref:(thale cress) hypothetical protein n=1 Tax=Arabidopsis thaliana TaxID=3702 RepID=A0A7G2EAZ9_ARATH|nr:unnamed protein product [Arabidopsis thaliana]
MERASTRAHISNSNEGSWCVCVCDHRAFVMILSSCAYLSWRLKRLVKNYVEHKHLFLASDTSHEQTKEVYRMLDEVETSVLEIARNTECG